MITSNGKNGWEVRFLNCTCYFPEQIGIELVRKKMRKDTRKANILASVSKLNKHLLGDPMIIGRREDESICSSISPGGNGRCLSQVRDMGDV